MHAPGRRHRIGYERGPRLNEDVDHRSRPHPCQCPCCTGLGSRPRRRMDTRIRMPGSVTTASATAPHHHPISSGLAASRLAAPRIATPAPRPNKTLAAVGCEVVPNISHIAACVTQDSPESTGPQMLHSYTPQKPTRQRRSGTGSACGVWSHREVLEAVELFPVSADPSPALGGERYAGVRLLADE